MSLETRVAQLAQRIGEEIAEGMVTFRFAASVSPTTTWKRATFDLPIPLNADRGMHMTILADAVSGSSSMVVGSLTRMTGIVTQAGVNYASIPNSLGTNTNILVTISGFPA